MTDYKSKLGGLAERLRIEPPAAPIQQVAPVKEQIVALPGECRFNNWIPKTLKKRLKQYAMDHEISLKDINIKALELFLQMNGETDSASPVKNEQ